MGKWMIVSASVLGGLLVVATAVHGAPSDESRVSPNRVRPSKAKPTTETISCPAKLNVKHAPEVPAGFRHYSLIRDYDQRICATDGVTVSAMSKTMACEYCDPQKGRTIKIVKPFPSGKTCRAHAASRTFSCR